MEKLNNCGDNGTIKDKAVPEIDYSQYKDTPEALFAIANKCFNKNEFEEGLSISEKSIELAEKKYKEGSIELALFYDKYSEGLIRKQIENDDILAIPKGNYEVETQQNRVISNQEDNNNNNNSSKIEDEEPQDMDDDQIAYENLMVANQIYLKYLKDYDLQSPSDLPKDIIKYYLQLADNYMLFGELETVKSDYAQAYGYYSKAATLRIKYDEKFSRCLAECYFKQASVLDYDPKKCLLSFFKTKTIMEFHLKQKVDCNEHSNAKDIVLDIDPNDLNMMEINEESKRIFVNRAVIESESMRTIAADNEDIGNLVDIINDLYLKIEDVITELKEFDRYMTEKKELNKKNEFTENYDKEKVIDISSTLVKKKRPRSPISKEEVEKCDKEVKCIKPMENKSDQKPNNQ